MKIWRLVFWIWIFFWVFFLIRGLYKGEFREYKSLLIRTSDLKKAYVVGEELYNFIEFCIQKTPSDSTYMITGILKPIEKQRFVYYLYPRTESKEPEYILCYNTESNPMEDTFYRFATLKEGQFILKKKRFNQ